MNISQLFSTHVLQVRLCFGGYFIWAMQFGYCGDIIPTPHNSNLQGSLGSRIVYMLWHVTHYYFINFVEGLFPLASEEHSGYTSLHKYVITISWSNLTCIRKVKAEFILMLQSLFILTRNIHFCTNDFLAAFLVEFLQFVHIIISLLTTWFAGSQEAPKIRANYVAAVACHSVNETN